MSRSFWLMVGAFMILVLAVNAIVLTLVASQGSNISSEAQNISTLLLNGKTASAISAKDTKKITIGVKGVVDKVEGQLGQILMRSDVNRQLVCSIAAEVHISSSTIIADCPKP